MKAVVLGASGLIGNAIVRELLARGHRVTAVGRRTAIPPNLVGLDIEHLRLDLDSEGLSPERLAGQDAVIDAAAPYALHLPFGRGAAASGDVIERADTRTERLLQSLKGRDLQLIYVGNSFTEQSRAGWSGIQSEWMRLVHPYFAIKRRIEARLAKAAAGGLRVVTVRPTACLGPYDVKPRSQCWIAGLVDGRLPIAPAHRLNIVDTRDFATAVVGAIESGYAKPALDVVGRNTTIDELFALVCELAGVPRPLLSLPAALGVLPSIWAEVAWAAVGRESPIPALLPMLICEQEWVDRKAPHPFGVEPRPIRDTVRDTFEWYRRLGYF